mmetsp:Transcript_25987/g.31868  ORF Transcript_25987/g.31868 Transcript_25987/m.31868 type:complete len:295 (-) Transcript_25987:16-900(-)
MTSHQSNGTSNGDVEAQVNEKSNLLSSPVKPEDARLMYLEKNEAASRGFHENRDFTEEPHQKGGDFLKAVIFGGLDGILTSFAIVAGATGGSLSNNVVLILGFSNIFADALSMGVGEFLSSKAHNEWVLKERSREKWEMDNYPEGEIKEMVEIYVSKGMSIKDAELVINTMAKYKEFFVDVMMVEELSLQVPEEDYKIEAMKEGFVMFLSFAFFGALPLLGYVIIPMNFPSMSSQHLFIFACIITGFVLFIMGSVKSFFSASNWFTSGAETLLLGGTCATVAYLIGQWVDTLSQ